MIFLLSPKCKMRHCLAMFLLMMTFLLHLLLYYLIMIMIHPFLLTLIQTYNPMMLILHLLILLVLISPFHLRLFIGQTRLLTTICYRYLESSLNTLRLVIILRFFQLNIILILILLHIWMILLHI